MTLTGSGMVERIDGLRAARALGVALHIPRDATPDSFSGADAIDGLLLLVDSGISIERGKPCKILWPATGLSRRPRLKTQLCNSLGECWNLATGLRDKGRWKWKVQGAYPV